MQSSFLQQSLALPPNSYCPTRPRGSSRGHHRVLLRLKTCTPRDAASATRQLHQHQAQHQHHRKSKHERLARCRPAPSTRLPSLQVCYSPGKARPATHARELEQNKLTTSTATWFGFTVLQRCLVGTKHLPESAGLASCVEDSLCPPSGYLHPALMNANNSQLKALEQSLRHVLKQFKPGM